MPLNHPLAIGIARSLSCCLLAGASLASAQTQSPQTRTPQTGNQGFTVGPAKDAAEGATAAGRITATSQVNSPDRTVGPQQDGSIVVSDNQTLTPAGKIVELGAPVRAKAIALNPNRATHTGAVLLMGSPQPIIVFDTLTGKVLQRFTPTEAGATPKGLSTGSFTGVTYSSDGRKLLFSQDNNFVVVTNVNPKTGLLTHEQRVSLPEPPADGRPYHNAKSINPGGIGFSEDNKRAYVALNVVNTLGVIDLTASPAKLIGQIPVGNVPNSVLVHGKYAYVSNEGGRPATSEDFTNYSDGTPIVVDRKDAFTITGTVSVVDLTAGKATTTVNSVDLSSNVSNIHHPSLTVYLPPKDKATGAAVIVAPGGGHARHAIQHEGYNVGEWLAAHGVAAFVLKYRLAKDDALLKFFEKHNKRIEVYLQFDGFRLETHRAHSPVRRMRRNRATGAGFEARRRRRGDCRSAAHRSARAPSGVEQAGPPRRIVPPGGSGASTPPAAAGAPDCRPRRGSGSGARATTPPDDGRRDRLAPSSLWACAG